MLRATMMAMLLTTVMVWVGMPSTCFSTWSILKLLIAHSHVLLPTPFLPIATHQPNVANHEWVEFRVLMVVERVGVATTVLVAAAGRVQYFARWLTSGSLWGVAARQQRLIRRSRTTGKNGKKQSKKRSKNIAFFQSSECAIFTARAQNFFTEYGYRIRLVRLSNTVGTSSPNTVGTLFGDGIVRFPESFLAIFCDS